MTSVYVDTNVFVYAIGTHESYRAACRPLVEAMGDGRLRGEIGALVLEEVGTYLRRRSVPQVPARVAHLARFVDVVHPVERADVEHALVLASEHTTLSMSDALHAAIAHRRGIGVLLSADPDFDAITGIRRVDPLDDEAVARLLASG